MYKCMYVNNRVQHKCTQKFKLIMYCSNGYNFLSTVYVVLTPILTALSVLIYFNVVHLKMNAFMQDSKTYINIK